MAESRGLFWLKIWGPEIMVAGDNCTGEMHRNEENAHKDVDEKGCGAHKLEIKNMFKKKKKQGASGEGREEALGWEM